jgi:hypothetical protein
MTLPFSIFDGLMGLTGKGRIPHFAKRHQLIGFSVWKYFL